MEAEKTAVAAVVIGFLVLSVVYGLGRLYIEYSNLQATRQRPREPWELDS